MLDDLKSPFLAAAQCLDLPEPCVDENGDNEGKGLWAESFCWDETSLKDDFDDDNKRKLDIRDSVERSVGRYLSTRQRFLLEPHLAPTRSTHYLRNGS